MSAIFGNLCISPSQPVWDAAILSPSTISPPAGDPCSALQEEPLAAPDGAGGEEYVNLRIDMVDYGGTAQTSLTRRSTDTDPSGRFHASCDIIGSRTGRNCRDAQATGN